MNVRIRQHKDNQRARMIIAAYNSFIETLNCLPDSTLSVVLRVHTTYSVFFLKMAGTRNTSPPCNKLSISRFHTPQPPFLRSVNYARGTHVVYMYALPVFAAITPDSRPHFPETATAGGAPFHGAACARSGRRDSGLRRRLLRVARHRAQ